MIFKAFEVSKINLSKYNLYLFYGENEGYKNEIIKNKFEIIYANQIYKYDEKEILENKNNFFNSILTKSFFENKKLIIISRVSDKIKDIIEEIAFKDITDITIVLSTNILEKKSKLRGYFEKGKNTICIPFYADTNQTLINIALNFFKENKISISQHTINLIIERSRGNRENLNNELEKINNYIKFGKKIDQEDILKLTNLAENYDVSENSRRSHSRCILHATRGPSRQKRDRSSHPARIGSRGETDQGIELGRFRSHRWISS